VQLVEGTNAVSKAAGIGAATVCHSSIQRCQRKIIQCCRLYSVSEGIALSCENVDDILFIIRIELKDYFVTIGVIAQLYAILAMYDVDCVLIVNNLFQTVKCVATPSNVIDQPMDRSAYMLILD